MMNPSDFQEAFSAAPDYLIDKLSKKFSQDCNVSSLAFSSHAQMSVLRICDLPYEI